MTAELAIFNREAVALAADSAMTVSTGDGSPEKVYRSARKLFELAESLPVAVMIYGDLRLMGIPWETIIRCYGRQLGRRRFDTLSEYAQDLFEYSASYLEYVEPHQVEDTARIIVENAIGQVLMSVDEHVENETPDLRDSAGLTDDRHQELLDVVTRKYLSSLSDCSVVKGMTKDLEKKLGAIRRTVVGESLDPLAIPGGIPSGTRKRLHRIAQLALTRQSEALESPLTTGLVFAGYGEREIFPVVYCYECNGLLGDLGPCRTLDMASDLDPDTGKPASFKASIFAFAQNDVVRTFIDGTDPWSMHRISRYTQLCMDLFTETAIEQLAAAEGTDVKASPRL